MTLTLHRAPVPRLNPRAARGAVVEAADRLQAALETLWAAQAEQSAKAAEGARIDEAARVKLRAAERATRPHAIVMDRRWLGEFGDALNACAAEVRKDGGSQSHVAEIARLTDLLGAEIERIETRAAL
jgi:hypothetical protein